jgi:hypothetical protein
MQPTFLRSPKSTSLQGKTILLISPKFFGYEVALQDKLAQMGANVTYFDDRPSNGLFSKSLIRINKKLLESKIASYYEEVTRQISHKKFDIIFLLNPEALPISFLRMCKSRWQDAQYVMYMWDSIKNRKHTLEFVPFCDRVFTFDTDDAEAHNFHFKPLFYLDAYSGIRRSNYPIKYDVCFMGTLHSDRYAIAKEVRDWCEAQGLRCFFYFFMHSRILYYFSQLKGLAKFSRQGAAAPRSEVSFKKMSTAQVVEIVASSRVVLDIQHPKQTGLTMRTLETIGAGKKLITANSKIRDYDFYREENIAIIDRSKPAAKLDLAFFLNDMKPVSEEKIASYSIGDWLLDLLS